MKDRLRKTKVSTRKLKILYHLPNPDTIYAGRTIFNGYKNAFEDTGHTFRTLTPADSQEELLVKSRPHIFITSLNRLILRYLDLSLLKKAKKNGTKVFVIVPFWNSPMARLRLNEAPSLKDNDEWIQLITSGDFGDIYFNAVEQGDERMAGFKKKTGYAHTTIPHAADKTLHFPESSTSFSADISFIGTALPGKRKFFKENIFPLSKKYNVRIYGQDWTLVDRALSNVQKLGQFYNLPYLKNIQKPKLRLEDERKVYTNSVISINVHEDYQIKFGGDCNERTFKIPLCGGFEITDDVECIRKYFSDGKEIIIAKNKSDWMEKLEYYLTHPEKRTSIIEAGRKKVLKHHTYHNRVEQILKLYNGLH